MSGNQRMQRRDGSRHNKTKVHFYPSYHFLNQDPVVDLLRSIKDKHDIKDTKAASDSGLSSSTMKGWWSGKTRCPRYASVAAYARSQGYDLAFIPAKIKEGDKKVEASMPTMISRFRTSPQGREQASIRL